MVVEVYKQLAEVEKAFRIMKGFALEVGPIRHRREERIRGHVFLCMLAVLLISLTAVRAPSAVSGPRPH